MPDCAWVQGKLAFEYEMSTLFGNIDTRSWIPYTVGETDRKSGTGRHDAEDLGVGSRIRHASTSEYEDLATVRQERGRCMSCKYDVIRRHHS